MKQYEITMKLWIKLEAEAPELAEDGAKTIVDEALYAYVRANNIQASVSKAKVIWVKENK